MRMDERFAFARVRTHARRNIVDNTTRGDQTDETFDAITFLLARMRATAAAVALGVMASVATPVLAEDNPHGLIDPSVISVGTMGDAKPYAFTTADGNFTGFDIELFLNVAERMGFKKDQVIFTGQEFSAP